MLIVSNEKGRIAGNSTEDAAPDSEICCCRGRQSACAREQVRDMNFPDESTGNEEEENPANNVGERS